VDAAIIASAPGGMAGPNMGTMIDAGEVHRRREGYARREPMKTRGKARDQVSNYHSATSACNKNGLPRAAADYW